MVRASIRKTANDYGKERALDHLKYQPLHRVRLMARGPRAVHAIANGLYPRSWDSFIPHKYAEYFDVYRGSDSHAMYKFRDQIENNLTPGQQALIDKLRHESWALEIEHLRMLRRANIVKTGNKNGTRYKGM